MLMPTKQIDRAISVVVAAKSVPQWQREAEARLSRRLAKAFRTAQVAALRRLGEVGRVPGDPMTRASVLQPLKDIEDDMQRLVAEGVQEAAEQSRRRAVRQVRAAGGKAGDVPGLSAEVTRRLREHALQAAASTMERLRGDVMGTLAEAYDQGWGIDKATRELRGTFGDMADWELGRIARTEIHSAQSDMTHETVRELNVQYKQWITSMDGRERDSHALVNGEITRIDEPFSNGLMYPGDPAGPLDETINCRCRERPYIMPEGYGPPPGLTHFRESDIVKLVA